MLAEYGFLLLLFAVLALPLIADLMRTRLKSRHKGRPSRPPEEDLVK